MDVLVVVVKIILDLKLNLPYIKTMWTPFDMFFIIWHCNFAPCQDARLNVKDIIHSQENKVITESVTLRNEN